MSAIRAVFWAGLALLWGAGIFLAGFGIRVAVEAQPVVLVPDSSGAPLWPVCAPDSTGRRYRVQWWPARVDR